MVIFYATSLLFSMKSECDLKGRFVKNIKLKMELSALGWGLTPDGKGLYFFHIFGNPSLVIWLWPRRPARQTGRWWTEEGNQVPFLTQGWPICPSFLLVQMSEGEMTIIFFFEKKLCQKQNLAYEVPVLPAFSSVALWIKDRILVIT